MIFFNVFQNMMQLSADKTNKLNEICFSVYPFVLQYDKC